MSSVFWAANCSARPYGPISSDGGVAGIGGLLSSMIVASITIFLSITIMVSESRRNPSVLRRNMLNSYSDQQILNSIGLSIVGLSRVNIMVPYHFFIIWLLSNVSTAVHIVTLFVLVLDFKSDPVLRGMRQILMCVSLCLNVTFGVFILQGVKQEMQDSILPVACVWVVDKQGQGNSTTASFIGTIGVIAANVIGFTVASWYLHSRNGATNLVKYTGTAVMASLAIGAAGRLISASDAFGQGPIYTFKDAGEKTWGFGSVVSLVALLYPLIGLVESIRGEKKKKVQDMIDAAAKEKELPVHQRCQY